MNYSVVWFTGESGAGKTTIAKALKKEFDAIILDGNDMRESISLGAGFSKEDRKEHNLRVARLANVLSRQQNVFVTVIAPMEDVRKEITGICCPLWIYVKKDFPEREGHFYEEPKEYLQTILVDEFELHDSLLTLRRKLGLILNE